MFNFEEEKIKEHCGVFGVFGHERAAELTYLGLFALQHRGEESSGIATSDGKNLYLNKSMGLVGEVFTVENIKTLRGHIAIGHVRYSTAGASTLTNAQPYMVDYSRGELAIAHNGNLVNAKLLRDELEAYGSIFSSTMDSEIIVHLMAKPSYRNLEESLIGMVNRIKGAFSLTMLTEDSLIGVRDPLGFRPLCLGHLDNAYLLASETCAFDLLEAKFIREIEPGEIIVINKNGPKSIYPFGKGLGKRAFCIFEHIYFARPDSVIFGESVGLVREKLGMNLSKILPVEVDMVIPVPDSGNFAAIGYARSSGVPFQAGFTRNHYIGRTFIQPAQDKREFNVRVKLNPMKEVIKDKRVVVIDDSIVRGNTSKTRIHTLRKAGAKEVHLRVSCPPHRFPCYYGIDFPSKEELIANRYSLEEIKNFLNVDSLTYQSKEGLLSSVSEPENYCTACFFGNYPTEIDPELDKYYLEKRKSG